MAKCQVCNDKNKEAPYKCPKCKITYCNIKCYRNHSSTCTETFYHDRVLDASRNVHKNSEQIKHMRNILQKEAKEWNFIKKDDDDDNNDNDKNIDIDIIEEMYEKLTVGENEGIDNTLEIIENMMSSSLRHEFESSIQDGNLQKSIIKKWNPWWINELIKSSSDDEADGMNEEEEESFFTPTNSSNLDEQLLQVPHFSKLPQRPSTTNKAGTLPPPPLQYNALSIIYSSILTLRLFYGEDNCRDEAQDSIHTFTSTCSVLSNNSKFYSLHDVLCSLKDDTKILQKTKSCYTPCAILLQDLVCVSENVRYVCKALLFCHELLSCKSDTDAVKHHKTLKRHAKKLMFYISWCKTYWKEICLDCRLSDDIRQWIDDNVIDVDDYSKDKTTFKII